MYIFEHLHSYTLILKDCGYQEVKKDDESNIGCNSGNVTSDFTGVVTPKEDNSIKVIPLTKFYIINLLFKTNKTFSDEFKRNSR